MIAFEDQDALDRHVQRVLLAHLDVSEAAAQVACQRTLADYPSAAVPIIELAVKLTFAVQRAAVMKLPLPVVRR